MSTIAEGFLIGVISACSLAAGLFFLKFWRRTRDFLFLAFGIAFLAQGANSAAVLQVPKPNEGTITIFGVRLLISVLILAAIVKKNVESRRG
jgi:hypothetical protein